ncbi:MAG: metal-dependent hydrolase [Candidatus Cohnella colombiensis]|uniref:Metal-dependent hydrolase n=1 Tax=Candidatus Cohnella colombiensis TaxID=3121368 RepID=A0AA95EWX7_9BACL|nr:MAG: metal-dependent hydrolase [Cohnella sp.]
MDTSTHFMFGLGLGGLAMIDPVVTSYPYGTVAVLIGTIAGSNAPDLDTILRLRSNAHYIKNHRGLSHCLPAILGWTALITACLALIFRGLSWWHIGFWVLIAVIVHVLVDLFNPFGTQAFRPLSRRWVSWNIIHLFDPFIFSSHLLAVVLWVSDFADPRLIFPTLYGLLTLYYIWRTIVHRQIYRKVHKRDLTHHPSDQYTVLPTSYIYRWNIVKRSSQGHYDIGEWEHGKLHWIDHMKSEQHPAIEASKQHNDVQAFLEVTPFPCSQLRPQSWGYEVRWVDIRYRNRKQYPFVAVVMMDFSFVPFQSYVGWLSDDRLEKRLRINAN